MAGDLKSEIQSKVLNGANLNKDTDKAIKRVKTVVTPVFCKELAERVGYAQGSRMIGLSSGYLNTALTRGEVSAVAEIAAKGVLDTMKRAEAKANANLPEIVYLVGKVPRDKVEAMTTVATALGIKLKEID